MGAGASSGVSRFTKRNRIDPVDPSAVLKLDPAAADAVSGRLPASRLPSGRARLLRQAGYAGADGPGGRGRSMRAAASWLAGRLTVVPGDQPRPGIAI